jgi:ribonuclease Y
MISMIIIAAIALIVGGFVGFAVFRYILTGKYKSMLEAAEKEAEVMKEKKLLEVRENFSTRRASSRRRCKQRNQKILQNENRLKQREITLNQRQEELAARSKR